MKGIIFNILEEFIIDHYGEDKFDEIISSCPLKTKDPIVGPGTYPDVDFFEIINKSLENLNLSLDDTIRDFGRYSFPKLAQKVPQFMKKYTHPKDFLKSVDDVIHVEVRKLYPGSVLPQFTYEDPNPNTLIINYKSSRKLCKFMEGLIEGTSKHFKCDIKYQQNRCMLKDDTDCQFEIHF